VGTHPSFIIPLSDSGIDILPLLITTKSLKELITESGIKRTQLFVKLKQAKRISLVRKNAGGYMLNDKIWNKAMEFFKELKKYEETTDIRVPGNAVIHHKNNKEIIFSSKENLDATLTAFSAYERFGIKLLTPRDYYYLPKKTLNLKDVFLHSLWVVEKEMNVYDLILVALFYAKYKKKLSRLNHDIISNIEKVFEGARISGYPTLAEIQDRADVYDIKIRRPKQVVRRDR
jgi:hypothetical protein